MFNNSHQISPSQFFLVFSETVSSFASKVPCEGASTTLLCVYEPKQHPSYAFCIILFKLSQTWQLLHWFLSRSKEHLFPLNLLITVCSLPQLLYCWPKKYYSCGIDTNYSLISLAKKSQFTWIILKRPDFLLIGHQFAQYKPVLSSKDM